MSRYIDGTWLLNFFVDIPDDYMLTVGNLRAVINDAPSVIPKPKEGEWIVKANGNNECSICGREKQEGWINFCGFCGARMRGQRNE